MIDAIDAEDAWWPPTLTPDRRLADAVGVVDDRGGEPEHAVLDRLEQAISVAAGEHSCEFVRRRHECPRSLPAAGDCNDTIFASERLST